MRKLSTGTAAIHARRRRRLVRKLGGGVLLLPASVPTIYSNDVENRYRPESDLFYLTGFPEPEAAAVLAPDCEEGCFWLLVRPRDGEKEVWTGRRAGTEDALAVYGADVARPIGELEKVLEELLDGAPALYYAMGRHPAVEPLISRVLERLRRARNRRAPAVVADPDALVREMRLIKDEAELRLMRRAASITCAAHRRAMAHIAPGKSEREVQAVIEYEFLRRGAGGPAYPTICGSGPNACTLHYIDNDRRMRDGELVLIDAGCEYDLYCADVTRTYPVSGRYSRAQRELYEVVLAAHTAAVAAVRPGVAWNAPHQAASEVLARGLAELGILEGTGREALRTGSYRRHFMHQTSHWLGLDVHDAGKVVHNDRPRRLASGMVLTIEPGLYLARDDKTVPTRYRGLGIRIEDDVLVVRGGHEILTDGLPRQARDIQRIMRGAQRR
jgi:Xaa-Pro aminopeptidase